MIMAAAGLQRLGLENYITEIIDPELILPAVSQGAIAIETRINDTETDELMLKINHLETWDSITAERAFLAKLQGGCQVPLGCYSKIENGRLSLHGFVASIDGKQYIRETISGELDHSENTGIALAEKMLEKGAFEILDQIKSTNNTH
jgi:hydroxymethylbilane synthase